MFVDLNPDSEKIIYSHFTCATGRVYEYVTLLSFIVYIYYCRMLLCLCIICICQTGLLLYERVNDGSKQFVVVRIFYGSLTQAAVPCVQASVTFHRVCDNVKLVKEFEKDYDRMMTTIILLRYRSTRD